MVRNRRDSKALVGVSAIVVTVVVSLAIVLMALPSLSAGTGWTVVQLSMTSTAKTDDAGYAGPVACPAVNHCIVVSQTQTSSGVNENIVSTQTSTGGWVSAVAPLPAGAVQATNFGPTSLACPAVGTCVATSVYKSATDILPDIIESTGGKWAAIAMPDPPGATLSGANWPDVSGIDCPAVLACVIVGTYQTSSGWTQGFVIRQTTTGFVAAESPTPGTVAVNHGATLSAVSCRSAGSCLAVGSYTTAANAIEPLVVGIAPSVLSSTSPPLPPNALAANPGADLAVVSCGSTLTCVAEGEYATADGVFGTIETSSSKGWTASAAPAPRSASATTPSVLWHSLSCTNASTCVAVGQFNLSPTRIGAEVAFEESGVWTAAGPPYPGTSTTLTGITCGSAAPLVCTGVGTFANNSGDVEGYILSISGTQISWVQAPLPSNARPDPIVSLNGIACPPTGACAISGVYYKTATRTVQLPMALTQ